MRFSSLRARVNALAVLFALLTVGSIAVTTYIVVAEGMQIVARDANLQLAEQTLRTVRGDVRQALFVARASGLSGQQMERQAVRIFSDGLPETFRTSGMSEAEFVVYDESLDVDWYSDQRAVLGPSEEREQAHQSRRLADEHIAGRGNIMQGMISQADLGTFVVHVPIDLPAGQRRVLDVVYFPDREEQVIARIRYPMAVLSVVAVALAVLMMQLSMGWVLDLVNGIRRAAESVDADKLSVHLPDYGKNEVGDLARSLNDLIDRLRYRANAQTRFVADASHELATPVAGIRGYVGILRAWGGEDPDVREEAIGAIDRESRRMARLCSDLLALIRSERFILKPTRFDINSLCREVLANAATRYIDKGLEFVGPEEGALFMYADHDKIEQVMSILVDNAAKYTPPGGTVEISTRRKKDKVVVEVGDTGIGISERDLASVFDRFYRSDQSRSQETGGFGLGLAIAKQLVEAGGGTISVQSVIGTGTTFTLRLPRAVTT